MARVRLRKATCTLIITIIGVMALVYSPIHTVNERSGIVNEMSISREESDIQKNHQGPLPQRNVTKEIAILGDVDLIRTWFELAPLVKCFQNGGNHTRKCSLYCPKQDAAITLSLVTDVADYRNKDAVVYGLSPFSLKGKTMRYLLDYEPPQEQLLVFYSMESPLRVQKWVNEIGKLRYHIDMTYLRDSDISMTYASYEPHYGRKKAAKKFGNGQNWSSNKTGLVAWMGSNCNKEVFWPRMDYINRLSSYIKVDLYGKCGSLACLPRLSQRCVNLMSTYKFYLAFENSECLDYITEKFWVTSLLNDVVPVVYGAPKSNIVKHVPPKSFIHLSDFKSAKELANYLQYLNTNDDLYNKFFEWKDKGDITVNYPQLHPSKFCELLEYIKPDDRHRKLKTVSESKWYNSCRHQIQLNSDHRIGTNVKQWIPWTI